MDSDREYETAPLVAEAGTDVAMVTIFDPTVLVASFDERMAGDGTLELLNEEQARGALARIETGADGSYLLHLFVLGVDGEIPMASAANLRDPIVIEPFDVPSGRLVFAGAEYTFRDDDSKLREFPHMGTEIAVPPGRWRLTLHRAEYADDEDDVLDALLSPAEHRAASIANVGCAVSIVGALGAIASVLAMSVDDGIGIVPLGTSVAIVVLGLLAMWLVGRSAASKSSDEKRTIVQAERPSIVATLTPLASSPASGAS